ncbi:Vegetative incompatibility protein HET-E-1 [Porphyridium purpureum]|uniref:Vegetative incompatibility protein HET-E-1 n=1 Tax=Porphyridium purpureum TaxID=35688 RepID=A0A5J4YMP1_PORPP|nr:Vegetative incompatibility protein HET-E-1 [Porphyridium purpureum]|eukprot:POR9200..scf246_12
MWTVDVKEGPRGAMAAVLNLTGHSDHVNALDFSPDGRFIASGSSDKTIKVWDAHTGACVRTLTEHFDEVGAVRFSPDGKLIASGSSDTAVKLWDAHAGACVRTMKGHSGLVWAVDFSPDGRFIASGSSDTAVKVWDTRTGMCVRTMTGHLSSVLALDFSSDGRYIASGSNDKTVKLWDAYTGACVRTMIGHADLVWVVQLSPDGQFIVSGSADKTVKLWDAHTGACVRTIAGHSNSVCAAHFSPDGRFIASGSADKTIKLWDADTGTCVRTITGRSDWLLMRVMRYLAGANEGHSGEVQAVRFSPDGRFIASGSADKTTKVWDTSDLHCGRRNTSSAPEEDQYCKGYWEIADSDGSGELDAQEALAFFSKARLSTSVLHRMWDEIAVARGKQALNYDDFVLALRFIALEQNGEEGSLARAQQGPLSLCAKIDIPGSNPFALGARTLSETAQHEVYWKLAQADGSGEVDVQGAVAFLSKSGLRNRVLNEIWGLATSQGVFSTLDMERFKTVLRLVAMAQKGMKLDLDEAAGGDMELIADIKVEVTTTLPEPTSSFARPSRPATSVVDYHAAEIQSPGNGWDTDLESMLEETPLDDLTCEQLARVLEEVLQVDSASVRNVREHKVNGVSLHDMRRFQEIANLSFPDKRKVVKWVAERKSDEGFKEYLAGVFGGDWERAEHAYALLEKYAISNREEYLLFRSQPSQRAAVRAIVRRFPELGTWPRGPVARK